MTDKITKLDKAAMIALRDPINEALKALGEQLGLTFAASGGAYGDGAEAHFKLVMKVNDPATKLAADRADWDRNCGFIIADYSRPDDTCLRPEDFGTEFDWGGKRFRAVGLSRGRGSGKFPIRCELVSLPKGHEGKVGEIRILPTGCVSIIRAATDAKAVPAKAAKRAKAA